MAEPEVFTTITEYEVSALPLGHRDRRYLTIYVVRRGDRWMVWDGFQPGQYLGEDGEWSFKDDFGEWWDAHRFALDAALELARQQAPKLTVNGITVADVLARTATQETS